MQLYYHKTSGGAEYLYDTFIECENGHKEGHINDDTQYVIRIDGDITKDAEISVKDKKAQDFKPNALCILSQLENETLKSNEGYIRERFTFSDDDKNEDGAPFDSLIDYEPYGEYEDTAYDAGFLAGIREAKNVLNETL